MEGASSEVRAARSHLAAVCPKAFVCGIPGFALLVLGISACSMGGLSPSRANEGKLFPEENTLLACM